jgi:hypothetical protein
MAELNLYGGGEAAAPGLESFHVASAHAVVVQKTAAQSFKESGFAKAIGSVEHIQTIGKGTHFDGIRKASPALKSHGNQDHRGASWIRE